MKKSILILSVTTLLFVGCNKNETIPTVDDNAMRIEVLHPSATRATSVGFEDGDKIGLFATTYNGDTPAPLQISGNWVNNAEVVMMAQFGHHQRLSIGVIVQWMYMDITHI